jgi:hypothetical protein
MRLHNTDLVLQLIDLRRLGLRQLMKLLNGFPLLLAQLEVHVRIVE